jgi:hypothetical protein
MYSWNPFHNGLRWTSLIALVLGVLIATLPITSAAQGVLLTAAAGSIGSADRTLP